MKFYLTIFGKKSSLERALRGAFLKGLIIVLNFKYCYVKNY